jgi:hypothetical protein
VQTWMNESVNEYSRLGFRVSDAYGYGPIAKIVYPPRKPRLVQGRSIIVCEHKWNEKRRLEERKKDQKEEQTPSRVSCFHRRSLGTSPSIATTNEAILS